MLFFLPPAILSPAPGQDAPAWLLARAQGQARLEVKHYLFEAYQGDKGWIARFVQFPEPGDLCGNIEQVFFLEDADAKPKALEPAKLEVNPEDLRWGRKSFRLVERRQLTQN